MSEGGAVEEESKGEEKPYPLKRMPHEKVRYIPGGFKGWHVIFVNDGSLANTVESSQIQGYLQGI